MLWISPCSSHPPRLSWVARWSLGTLVGEQRGTNIMRFFFIFFPGSGTRSGPRSHPNTSAMASQAHLARAITLLPTWHWMPTRAIGRCWHWFTLTSMLHFLDVRGFDGISRRKAGDDRIPGIFSLQTSEIIRSWGSVNMLHLFITGWW